MGAFLFAQASLPLLLNSVGSTDLPPTLIFTGATASVKANTWLQPFNVPKHALRGHAKALHDEFAPQGVHVAHVIVDGVIRMPLTWWLKPLSSWDAKLDPDAVSHLSFTNIIMLTIPDRRELLESSHPALTTLYIRDSHPPTLREMVKHT